MSIDRSPGSKQLARVCGVLGLALVILLGIGTPVVSASFEFHSEISPTTLTGSQASLNEFEIESGITECESATFSGTLAAKTATAITLTPSYKECTSFGLESEVDMNGCALIFTASGALWNSLVHIECSMGTKIEITVINSSICTISIGPQNSTGEVHFQNGGVGTQRDILFNSTINGISYSTKGELCGSTESSFGQYRGSVTVKGEDKEGFQWGIWVA